MNVEEFDTALSDLETRVDRLRALYENWFRGYEKLEPGVARKDVERRVYGLRKELPRNTALRFRYHQLYQRYTTLATYWARTARQIEEGTYRRQLQRIKRRREDEVARSLGPPPMAEGDSSAPPPEFELNLDETLDVSKLLDDFDLDQVASALEVSRPVESLRPGTVTGELKAHVRGAGAMAVPGAAALGAAALGSIDARGSSPRDEARGSVPRELGAEAAAVSEPVRAVGRFARPNANAGDAPAALGGTRGSQRPPALAPANDGGPTVSRGPANDVLPAANSMASKPPAVPVAARGAVPMPPPPSRGAVPAPPARGTGSIPMPPAPSTGTVPMPPPRAPGVAAPGARPSLPGAGTAPGARPSLPGAGTAPGARPSLPGAGAASAAVRAAAGAPSGAASGPGAVSKGVRPAAHASLASVDAAARPADASAARPGGPTSGQPAAPSAAQRPAVRPQPAAAPAPPSAARPQPRAAQPSGTVARSEGGLDDQRMRRIYEEYAAAKRRNNEGEVRFETLAGSIQKMMPDLTKKHAGKQIDFEIVMKDGRVGLKPKAT